MSTTVDHRVVEMQFDNAHFERNVATTMSSLDKLKQSLRLSDATKGFEDVSTAAKRIDLSGLSGAAETVGLKFSAMYTIADQALRNITNSAMAAGKKITSALTIDPIKTGFSEYETQINAVQTILANTQSKGTTLQDVNAALDQLNTYADKTIYNFTEMTKNIGTFTAAGIDLDTSVTAIQGIANLAAVSGSTSQQASTAMYQLSQALASGTVKLMDWNSVVNAGMGGQVFQDALKETARVHGVAIDEMIKDEGSFRETLKNEWLTSEILTETLAKFTMATEGLTDAQIEQNRQMLKSQGYTDKQIEEIFKLGDTATNAATKVKTFTQLWDTLKESAQSGWTQSWETIVGDFEESKELLTKISDTIGGMIGASAEARNSLLKGGLSSGWKQFLDEGIADEAGFKESITEVVKESGIAFDEIIKKKGSFEAAFASGLKNGTITSDMMAKSVTNLADKMRKMSKEEREAAGYTEEHLVAIEELEAGLKNGSVSMDEFMEKMKRPSGRENLIKSLWNAFEGLMNIVNPIKEAFRDIFPPMTAEQLYSFTEKVRDLTASFKEFTSEHGDEIKSIFTGIFSVLDIGLTVVKNLGRGLMDLIGHFTGFGGSVLETAGSFGDWLSNLRDTVKETNVFGNAVDKAVGFIEKIIDKLKEFGSSVKASFAASGYEGFAGFLKLVWKFVSKIASSFGDAFMSISDALINVFDGSVIDNLFNTGLFAALLMGVKKVVDTLKDILEGGGGFLDNIKGILDDVRGCFEAYQNNLNAETLKKIATAIGILAASILVVSLINPERLNQSLGAISVLFMELMGAMTLMTKVASGMKGVLKAVPMMLGMSTAILMLSGALMMVSSIDADSAAQGLMSIGVLMAELVGAIYLFTVIGGKSMNGIKKAAPLMIGMSVAVLMLTGAMKILSTIDSESAAQGLMSIGVLLAELAIFSKVAGNANNIVSTGFAMILLGGAMNILAYAVKNFSGMSMDEIGRGLISMAGALAAITLALKFMPANMVGIGVGFVAVSAAMLILAEAVKSFASMGAEESAKAITIMGVALLELVVALNYMNGAIGGAAALIIAAGALAILAPVMKTLGSLSWGQIIKGLVSIAGAFAIVGAAGLLLGPLLPSILGLAAAFALFGAAALGIGAGLTLIGIGLSAIAAGFTALAVAGTAGATAVVTALSIIILGIADLIPKIAEKLGEAIVAFAEVIGECAPQIADAILKLIVEVLSACEEYIPQIVDSLFGLLIGVINALAERMPELIVAAVNLIGAFFQGVVDALSGLDTESLFKGIAGVALMSGLMFALSAVASLIPGAMVGVLGMGAVIAELAIVLAAIGALAQIPGLEWLISEGGDMLQTIGTAIGQFFGGILGGIAEGATSTLPQIGTHLSDFMTNATPFIEGVKTIDPASLEGVKALTDIILTLTAAGVLDSITSWLTGGSSLTNFAQQLVPFGAAIAEFSRTVSGNIDEGAVLAAANAGKIMAEMASTIPNTGGVVSWFTGDNAMNTFGNQLIAFGIAITSFSRMVSGNIDEGAVTAAANAGAVMVALAETIPNTGGIVSWFTGDNAMDDFGEQIVSFGEAMVDFSKTISGNIDSEAVVAAASAGIMLAELANNLPDSGGFASIFTKDNDMSTFGKELVKFGESLNDFSEEVAGIDTSKVSSVVTQFKRVAEMASSISTMNFDGLNTLGDSLSSVSKRSVNQFISAFEDAGDKAARAMSNMIEKLINSANAKANSIGKVFTTMLKDVISGIGAEANSFREAGANVVTNLVHGMKAKAPEVKTAAETMAKSAGTAMRSAYNTFYNAGSYVSTGFALGISANDFKAEARAKAMAKKAIDAAEAELRIASPSRVSYGIGDYFGQGFVNAISDYANVAYKASSDMAASAREGLSKSISRISEFISSDIDTQPTIRPVLDLSSVKSGAGVISSLFNTDPSVGVLAEVGTISTMMNRRNQNGTNDDIISAIDKFRDDFKQSDRTTYNINGITYDDGSNLRDAIETIIRYANIERRV